MNPEYFDGLFAARPIGGTEPVLPLTGERTVPGIASENYWFRRHEAAYEFVLGLLDDGAYPDGGSPDGGYPDGGYPDGAFVGVLAEIGAGEGYGAAMLADRAGVVIAVDYDPLAITHLARRYPRLHPLRANLAALPIADGTVDVLVSLQVIEHVWNHPQFVAECLRVLRPGGRLVLSTPNRLTFSPGLDTPTNPFHTHEFTAVELSALVGAGGFEETSILGLHAGSRLRSVDAVHGVAGGFVNAQLACAPDQWSADLAAAVASISTADFTLADTDIDSSLDLVLLARRP